MIPLLGLSLMGYSVGEVLIGLVAICGLVAIAFIAMRAMGVTPPAWFIQIAWVVVIVVVAIFAIRLVMSL